MEYITRKFENTLDGLNEKDAFTKQQAAQGFRIVNEQVERGDIKGHEQCCGALICLPLVFLAGRTPGKVHVTYGRETLHCSCCGDEVIVGQRLCATCKAQVARDAVADRESARLIAENKQAAERQTADIKRFMRELDTVLVDSLAIDHRFNWDFPRTKAGVAEAQPELPDGWPREISETNHRDEDGRYRRAVNELRDMRDAVTLAQANEAETRKRLYLEKDRATLLQYWAIVLERSIYPLGFPRYRTFDYAPEEQRLIIDFALPQITCLPQLKEVKYDPSSNTLENVPASKEWLETVYGELIIKIALRTLYELFQSDVAEALDSVAFNGSVQAIDKSNGHEKSVFVISVETSKPVLGAINLAQVDPGACFTRLGGSLSENLAAPTPVEPIRLKRLMGRSAGAG
jgi:hypothetical protein